MASLRFLWSAPALELHITGPPQSTDATYVLSAEIQGADAASLCQGGSLRILSLATGLVEEAYFDAQGRIAQEIELSSEKENRLRLTVVDAAGRELVAALLSVGPAGAWQAADMNEAAPAAAEAAKGSGGVLEPPWPRFAKLVRDCLIEAGRVAQSTGRPPHELFEQVYAQERYAEKAFAEHDQRLYQECFDNLNKFAAYLEQLKDAYL